MALRSSRRFISQTSVQSGMMVEFSYTKKDSTTSKYSVMVIDPDRNGHLHGVLIDDLSDEEILDFADQVGGKTSYDLNERAQPLTELRSDEAYDKYKSSKFSTNRRYRTFLLSKMTTLRQILIGEIK